MTMKLRKVPKVSPPRRPLPWADEEEATAGDERFVWESLVPRLVHPLTLSVVEALLRADRPLSATEMAPMLAARHELVLYHCKHLAGAGVLEIAGIQTHPERNAEEPCFRFPARVTASPPSRAEYATAG